MNSTQQQQSAGDTTAKARRGQCSALQALAFTQLDLALRLWLGATVSPGYLDWGFLGQEGETEDCGGGGGGAVWSRGRGRCMAAGGT